MRSITAADAAIQLAYATHVVVVPGYGMAVAQAQHAVRELAKAMNEIHARFITITAYQLPKDEGFRLEYHWDLDGRLLGFSMQLAGKSIESIFDLTEAADWIEREIHEEYGIDFTGREYEPLLLRQGETPGVNLRDVVAASDAVAASSKEKI